LIIIQALINLSNEFGVSRKLDTPKGHEKYALDEYIKLFINPGFELKGNQAYQDIIYPGLLLEGLEPFCAISSYGWLHVEVYFRRKIKPK